MRAAYLIEPGKIEVRDAPVPEAGPGEIVVRVEEATTCGTDLKAFRRGHPFIPMPGPFGHQFAGRVAATGAGVKSLAAETPVWAVHSAPCDECSCCRRGRPNLCRRLGDEMALGAFAEYLRLPARVVRHNVFPRPPAVPARRAVFLEPVSCVAHGLRLLDWRGVERVLVLGLGGMGLLFCQLIPEFTRAHVVAAGRRAARLSIAAGYAAVEQVVDVAAAPPEEIFGGAGLFDVVIECTGRPEAWTAAAGRTAPGGQTLFFGGLPRGSRFLADTYRLHYDELRLSGCFHFGPDDVRQAAAWLAGGDLDVESLISGVCALDMLDEALETMAEGDAIKFAVDPTRR